LADLFNFWFYPSRTFIPGFKLKNMENEVLVFGTCLTPDDSYAIRIAMALIITIGLIACAFPMNEIPVRMGVTK